MHSRANSHSRKQRKSHPARGKVTKAQQGLKRTTKEDCNACSFGGHGKCTCGSKRAYKDRAPATSKRLKTTDGSKSAGEPAPAEPAAFAPQYMQRAERSRVILVGR